jgi:hypothetical protein
MSLGRLPDPFGMTLSDAAPGFASPGHSARGFLTPWNISLCSPIVVAYLDSRPAHSHASQFNDIAYASAPSRSTDMSQLQGDFGRALRDG